MNSHIQSRMRDAFRSPKDILHAYIRDNDTSGLRRQLELPDAIDMINHRHYAFGTPLHVAIWCDNLAAVEILLHAGADPQTATLDSEGITCLTQAIRHGRRAIFERLWHHDPPENHANGPPDSLPCLVEAAQYGQVSIVSDLLIWWDGWTDAVKDEALLSAASRWEVHVVDLLLTRLNFSHQTLVQALHKAAEFKFMMGEEERSGVHYNGVDYLNQQHFIARLIDTGVDPNTRFHGRHIIFMSASAVDLAGGLKVLLEKGADPNTKNHERNEQSALHLVSLPIQLRHQCSESCLHETGIRLLLQHGASVTQLDAAGNTPLHYAAFGANIRIFQLYLSTCASEDQSSILNIENHHGETLLHWAAAGGKIDILQYLLFRGVNVNATSANGWTPLICALAPTLESRLRGSRIKKLWEVIQAAQLLLFHGANPLISTTEGWTPLHCLARYLDDDEMSDARKLADVLITRGVDVEARATMLSRSHPRDTKELRHCEFAWGFEVPEMIKLAAGKHGIARPGLTPLHWAAEHGAVGVAKALLAHGADPSSKSPYGTTPAQIAVEGTKLPDVLRSKEKLVQLFTGAGGSS